MPSGDGTLLSLAKPLERTPQVMGWSVIRQGSRMSQLQARLYIPLIAVSIFALNLLGDSLPTRISSNYARNGEYYGTNLNRPGEVQLARASERAFWLPTTRSPSPPEPPAWGCFLEPFEVDPLTMVDAAEAAVASVRGRLLSESMPERLPQQIPSSKSFH